MNTRINIAPAFVAAVIASLYSYSHSCSHSFGCRYRSWLPWKSVEYLMHPALLTGFFIGWSVPGMDIFQIWFFIRIHVIQHNIVRGLDVIFFLLRLLGGQWDAFVQTFFDIAENEFCEILYPIASCLQTAQGEGNEIVIFLNGGLAERLLRLTANQVVGAIRRAGSNPASSSTARPSPPHSHAFSHWNQYVSVISMKITN